MDHKTMMQLFDRYTRKITNQRVSSLNETEPSNETDSKNTVNKNQEEIQRVEQPQSSTSSTGASNTLNDDLVAKARERLEQARKSLLGETTESAASTSTKAATTTSQTNQAVKAVDTVAQRQAIRNSRLSGTQTATTEAGTYSSPYVSGITWSNLKHLAEIRRDKLDEERIRYDVNSDEYKQLREQQNVIDREIAYYNSQIYAQKRGDIKSEYETTASKALASKGLSTDSARNEKRIIENASRENIVRDNAARSEYISGDLATTNARNEQLAQRNGTTIKQPSQQLATANDPGVTNITAPPESWKNISGNGKYRIIAHALVDKDYLPVEDIIGSHRVDNAGKYVLKVKHLDDNQRKTLNVLLANGDENGFKKYWDAIEYDIDKLMTENVSGKVADISENYVAALPLSMLTTVGGVPAVIGQVIDTVRSAADPDYLGPNPYSSYNSPTIMGNTAAQTATETVNKNVTEFFSDKIGLSGAQAIGKAAEMLASAGIATAQMLPAIAFGHFGTKAATMVMSISAAGSSAVESQKSGQDAGSSLLQSIISGLTEYVTEYLPMDNLLKLATSGKRISKAVIRDILIQAGAEGTEELVSEYANTLTDMAINGGNSEYERYKQSLIESGYDAGEATRQANIQFFITNPLESMVVGSLAGGMMGSGAVGSSHSIAIKAQKISKDTFALFDQSVNMSTSAAQIYTAIDTLDLYSQKRAILSESDHNGATAAANEKMSQLDSDTMTALKNLRNNLSDRAVDTLATNQNSLLQKSLASKVVIDVSQSYDSGDVAWATMRLRHEMNSNNRAIAAVDETIAQQKDTNTDVLNRYRNLRQNLEAENANYATILERMENGTYDSVPVIAAAAKVYNDVNDAFTLVSNDVMKVMGKSNGILSNSKCEDILHDPDRLNSFVQITKKFPSGETMAARRASVKATSKEYVELNMPEYAANAAYYGGDTAAAIDIINNGKRRIKAENERLRKNSITPRNEIVAMMKENAERVRQLTQMSADIRNSTYQPYDPDSVNWPSYSDPIEIPSRAATAAPAETASVEAAPAVSVNEDVSEPSTENSVPAVEPQEDAQAKAVSEVATRPDTPAESAVGAVEASGAAVEEAETPAEETNAQEKSAGTVETPAEDTTVSEPTEASEPANITTNDVEVQNTAAKTEKASKPETAVVEPEPEVAEANEAADTVETTQESQKSENTSLTTDNESDITESEQQIASAPNTNDANITTENTSQSSDMEYRKSSAVIEKENNELKQTSSQWDITPKNVSDSTQKRRNTSSVNSINDIIKDIENRFRVPISAGSIANRAALGLYRTMPRTIRTKYSQNLPVIAHELGHHIDIALGVDYQSMDGFDEILRNDIPRLKEDGYDENVYANETFAEFIREYLSSKSQCESKYGTFYNSFVDYMSSTDNKVLKKEWADFEAIADNINEYMSASLDDRERAHIQTHAQNTKAAQFGRLAKQNPPAAAKKVADRFVVTFVNKYAPIRNIELDTTGDCSTYREISRLDRLSGITNAAFTEGLTDLDGNLIENLPSIKEIIASACISKKQLDDFDLYLKLRRALELDEVKIRTYDDPQLQDPERMKNRISELEINNPKFESAAKQIYRFQNTVLYEYGVRGGVVSQELYDKLTKMYPSYVPFYRVIDDTASQGRPGNAIANQNTPVKRIGSSGRPTYSILENIMLHTSNIISAGARNKAGNDFARMVDTNRGLGWAMERISPENVEGVQPENVVDLSAAESEDIGETIEKSVTQNTQSQALFKAKGYSRKNVVSFMSNGVKVYYQVHDDNLLDALVNLHPASMSEVTQFMRVLTTDIKLLTTGSNPYFGPVNVLRDFLTGYISSTTVYNPIKYISDWAEAIKNIAANDEIYREYQRMGGGFAGAITESSPAFRRALRTVRDVDAGKVRKILRISGSVLDNVMRIIDMGENITRLSEYKRTLAKTGDKSKAAYNAARVTVNFSQSGKASNVIDAYVLYFKASVNALDQMAHVLALNAKEDGAKAVVGSWMKMLGTGLFFGGLAQLWNRLIAPVIFGGGDDDDEDKIRYNDVSSYIKNRYWIFSSGDGKFVRVPKPQSYGALSSTIERALDYMLGDSNSFYDFGDYVANLFVPAIDITMAGSLIDIASNKSWSGSTIVSPGLENLDARLQYNESTMSPAVWLGDRLGVSPLQIQYFINQNTGFIGKLLSYATPIGTYGEGKNPFIQTAENFFPNALGGFSKLFTADSAYSTDIVSKFYDDKRRYDEAYNSYRAVGEDGGRYSLDDVYFHYKYDRYASLYSDYNAASKATENEQEAREIRFDINGLLNIVNGSTTADFDRAVIDMYKGAEAEATDEAPLDVSIADFVPYPTIPDSITLKKEKRTLDYDDKYLYMRALYNDLYAHYLSVSELEDVSDALKVEALTEYRSNRVKYWRGKMWEYIGQRDAEEG